MTYPSPGIDLWSTHRDNLFFDLNFQATKGRLKRSALFVFERGEAYVCAEACKRPTDPIRGPCDGPIDPLLCDEKETTNFILEAELIEPLLELFEL